MVTRARPLAIDWDAATREATDLLQAYLRIDTSNPPGNETEAVNFLRKALERDGFVVDTAGAHPERLNLHTTLGPLGSNVCLLSHSDVVPVERQYWDVEPFGGDLRDGHLWGRGALDMKSMGIMELMVLLLLRRHEVPLRRGIRLIAAADEEAGSALGVSWIAKHRPDWMQSDLVINEGAYGLAPGTGDRPIFQFAPSEKIPVWVRLTARGRPGHGSVPHADNCAERLVRALGRVAAWEQPLRITPLMRAHVDGMRAAGAHVARKDAEVLALAQRSPAIRTRLSNTIALTTVNTGIKVNVIPAEATATLDCRLLPDVDVDEFLAGLAGVIADDRVGIEVLNRFVGAASPIDHEFVSVVDDVVREMSEGAHLVPDLMSGFTDSRIYRLQGTPAYGFVPCLVPPEELSGIHGHNERISVDNLRLGMQLLFEVVRRLCAA